MDREKNHWNVTSTSLLLGVKIILLSYRTFCWGWLDIRIKRREFGVISKPSTSESIWGDGEHLGIPKSVSSPAKQILWLGPGNLYFQQTTIFVIIAADKWSHIYQLKAIPIYYSTALDGTSVVGSYKAVVNPPVGDGIASEGLTEEGFTSKLMQVVNKIQLFKGRLTKVLGSLLAIGWRMPSVPFQMGLSNMAACLIKDSKRESPLAR